MPTSIFDPAELRESARSLLLTHAPSTGRWRWLALGHVVITASVVSATGHHWWLDGIVSIALLGVALAVDRWVRGWFARRGPAEVEGTDADDRSAPVEDVLTPA